jgi:hypothetical protein
VIYKVVIESQVMPGLNVNHHFEQVVDDVEESETFGELCAHLMQAFINGFGEAELGGEQ